MPRKCKLSTCKSPILPFAKSDTLWHKKGFCQFDHMVEYGNSAAKALRERQQAKQAREARAARVAERKAHRERKERVKSRTEWAREAQQAVNQYVRLRDAGKPCVSCDKPDDGHHQRHASHYRSTKACPSLRFNLKNIYASCAQCNTMQSGNLLEYRIRLRARYGDNLVDWLESQNGNGRYSVDYLKRLRDVFRRRVARMKKRQP